MKNPAVISYQELTFSKLRTTAVTTQHLREALERMSDGEFAANGFHTEYTLEINSSYSTDV